MDYLHLIQGQSPAVKGIASIVVALLAALLIRFIWQAPPPDAAPPAKTVSPPSSPSSPATPTHITTANDEGVAVGVNNGVVAKNHFAGAQPSAAQEDLARAQLADIKRRERQDAEDRERQRQWILVDSLRTEYLHSLGDGLPDNIVTGGGFPPDEWMNDKLRERGEPFVFKGGLANRFTLERR